ncbi:MAG: hypothetical protein ACE14L_09570 [Terriglobales bacterium]
MKRRIALILVLLVVAAAVALAAKAPGQKEIMFSADTKIGDVLIPAGNYKVTHVEEAGKHIMIFKAGSKAPEYRVNCTLEPLTEKVTRTEQHYRIAEGGVHLLSALIFAGDNVRHVFR